MRRRRPGQARALWSFCPRHPTCVRGSHWPTPWPHSPDAWAIRRKPGGSAPLPAAMSWRPWSDGIDEWGRDGLLDLAYALVALSKGLGEKEAAGFCAAAARRILKTQNLRTLSEDGAAMNREFFALQALASSLGEKEAVEVANLMRQLAVDSTAAEPDGNRRRMCIRVEMAETMMVLSGRMGEKEAWEFAGRSLEDMLLMAYVPPSQA